MGIINFLCCVLGRFDTNMPPLPLQMLHLCLCLVSILTQKLISAVPQPIQGL